MNLQELKKELTYKWRIQSTKYGKASCVAYIDARDAQHAGQLFSKVGIKCNDTWVWKSDCGTESNIEKEKGRASDAFKRACVAWGIGRFLYRLDIQTLPTKDYKGRSYPYAPEKDKIIFDGDTLTKYINWKISNNK
jgi:hypothetical protein